MKVLYSFSHPGDQLDFDRAGHVVRANAILAGLEGLGHEVIRIEAAKVPATRTAVNVYRGILKRILPRPFAMILRDFGRIAHGRRHAMRLFDAIRRYQPDIILETFLAFNLAGTIAAEQSGIPLVVDDVAPAWEEERIYGVGLKKSALKIFRQMSMRANTLVAVNNTIKQYLLDEGLPEKKIIVVENGIDNSFFNSAGEGRKRRHQFGIPSDAVVIVFVGSFQPFHRVDLLLHAFKRMNTKKKTHLLLIGQGNSSNDAKTVAEELGLKNRVTFTGRVPYREVASYASVGDIAVMPATNEYTNPMKVYEYMALGKAIVAPNQNNIREIITHNQTALLFERENVGALSSALNTLVEDGSLRERISSQAGRFAAEHTWQKRAAVFQQVFHEAGLV